MMRILITISVLVSLGACSSVRIDPHGKSSYRYSSFNFSGDSWTAQKRRCEAQGMKPRHLGTDCGFWTCVSRYDCEPEQ
jgi:uncharacterized protein YceK